MKDIEVIFPKLYKNNRRVTATVSVPFAEGECKADDVLNVYKNGVPLLSQFSVISTYPNGSVKFGLLRFLCELPGNRSERFTVGNFKSNNAMMPSSHLKSEYLLNGVSIKNQYITLEMENDSSCLFCNVVANAVTYSAGQFAGPVLKTDDSLHRFHFTHWEIENAGPVYAKASCSGFLEGLRVSFDVSVTLSEADKMPEVSVRLINTTEEALHVQSLWFAITAEDNCAGYEWIDGKICNLNAKAQTTDSTGCGDLNGTTLSNGIVATSGVSKLKEIAGDIHVQDGNIRTIAAHSNYKTSFEIGKSGERVSCVVDADSIIGEANEHYNEVFYGTFFADRTDARKGVCATVFQAQQNFPKAVMADEDGVYVMLVPENTEKIEMSSGMSREQRFSLLFHEPEMPIEEIDDLSLRYQMPDRPYISPDVFKSSGIFPDIFTSPENWNEDVEIALVGKADSHMRVYGMLNFGDVPDMNYTTQGRGGKDLVWSNNEYDYPHACALMYVRTGERRFLDYCIAASKHWMDVDVCHFSANPLFEGGQWEHTCHHNGGGLMVCSHEWVEGLLDYYHLTGDKRGLDTAVGIGENVCRLLETPMYQVPGESNARETGWALRSLTALYVETHDRRWVEKCDWIVSLFADWQREYGSWIAPYTDNTMIRTGFMISVAVGSLMRYYREFPNDGLKALIIAAIDDLLENATLPYGLFYYKELPSLSRNGNNPLLLEALAIGYELTGNVKYLKAGIKTFKREIDTQATGSNGAKIHREDAVLWGNGGTKHFAQGFIPFTTFYTALLREGLI